jgi:outer membrane receptor protein involved in Fe transport
MKFQRLAVPFFLLLLLSSSAIFAQGVQTATLDGSVVGNDGVGLPGVTVTLKSPALMGERQTVTNVSGDYNLRGLPPGDYQISFALEGMQTVNRKMTLALGLPTRSDVKLKLAGLAEAITVTASGPTVLENTTVGANIKAETVQQLPVVRTPTGIASLAAGVTDRTPVGGQLSMSGGIAYDNSFLVNGVNVQDNIFGNTNNLFIEDAIQETQVLTSGISAEYGHFTGGVLNVITKSGGNQFSGSVRDDLSKPAWLSTTPFEQGFRGVGVTAGKPIAHIGALSNIYEVTLGGPIVRDRLWFFVAGRDENSTTPNTLGVTGTQLNVVQQNRRPEYKLTANLGASHTIQGDYINNPVTRDNEIQVSPIDTTAVAHNSVRANHGYNVSYSGVMTSNFFGEARYSQKVFQFIGLGGTLTDIVNSPMRSSTRFPGNASGTFNAPYFDATDPENRNNKQAFAALSYFLSRPKIGSHDIKGGFEEFTDTRTGGNSQTATGFVFYTGYKVSGSTPVLDSAGHLIPVFNPDPNDGPTTSRIGNWLATRGSELDTKTDSLFLNDRWTLNNNFTFNLGLRHEKVKSNSTGDIVAVNTSSTVPRLAASYDPMGNGKFKFDVTYAQYAGRYNPALIGANSNVGNPALLYGYYVGPKGEGRNFAPGFDPKNYVFYYASVPTANVFVGNGLHSPVSHEYTFSAGTQLPKGGWAKATFTDRQYKDFIEDFITIAQGSTDIVFGGVDAGRFDNVVYKNSSGPKRHYQAVELQTRYDLTRHWGVEGNLTHQFQNNGTYEGEAGQSIPTSAFGNRPEIQSPRELPTGRLAQFEADKVRLWTTYNFDLHSLGNLTTALIYRYDSPLTFSFASSTGRSAISKSLNPGYLSAPKSVTIFYGDRGVGQFNATSLVDASLQYSLPIASRLTPWVKVDVRNLLNSDTLTTFSTAVVADPNSPVDALGYHTGFTKGTAFGRPVSTLSYVTPRQYLIFAGIRF